MLLTRLLYDVVIIKAHTFETARFLREVNTRSGLLEAEDDRKEKKKRERKT